jgi:ABC-type Mn2+/Zn2+ transport system permease subunit
LFIGDHKWLGVASVGVGIISAYTGVMMSLTFNDIPAGSMMVLSAFTFFVLAVVVKRIKVRCVA